MSENTKIEWATHTFNPWEGCQKVGQGCDNCYAETRNARFAGGTAINWGPGAPRRRTSAANWAKPLTWNANHDAYFAEHGHRQRVFCASLADVFDNAADPQWRVDLFELIRATPNLDWLLLTKRIGNAKAMIETTISEMDIGHAVDFAAWPYPNVWIGATIVNQEEADRDIPKLLAVPAAMHFLSMEPLLGPVDLTRIDIDGDKEIYPLTTTVGCVNEDGEEADDLPAIDWVIVGGESGPCARPMHPDWARSLRDQCDAAGVPFLFKQWGGWVPTSSGDFCRSPTAPEHAEFREKHGRGGYEFAGKEGLSILRDGRTCIKQEGGSIWQKPAGQWIDQTAKMYFNEYVKTGKNDPGYQWMYKVGKKAAGRLLDGRTWDGVPS